MYSLYYTNYYFSVNVDANVLMRAHFFFFFSQEAEQVASCPGQSESQDKHFIIVWRLCDSTPLLSLLCPTL